MLVPGGQYKHLKMQDGATATGNGTVLPTREAGDGSFTLATIQVEGITTATITWKGRVTDEASYVEIQATNRNDGSEATTATADGIYQITCLGFKEIMADITAYTSGTINVWGVASA